MSVYRGISGGAGKVLSISVWNMLSSFGVSESLGEAEIDDVHEMLFFTDSNQEVIRLDISVQEMS